MFISMLVQIQYPTVAWHALFRSTEHCYELADTNSWMQGLSFQNYYQELVRSEQVCLCLRIRDEWHFNHPLDQTKKESNAHIFQAMISTGALDMINNIQVFAFQYAFKPIIQQSLDCFQDAYNWHHLTSEGSRSQQQPLFVAHTGTATLCSCPQQVFGNFRKGLRELIS